MATNSWRNAVTPFLSNVLRHSPHEFNCAGWQEVYYLRIEADDHATRHKSGRTRWYDGSYSSRRIACSRSGIVNQRSPTHIRPDLRRSA